MPFGDNEEPLIGGCQQFPKDVRGDQIGAGRRGRIIVPAGVSFGYRTGCRADPWPDHAGARRYDSRSSRSADDSTNIQALVTSASGTSMGT